MKHTTWKLSGLVRKSWLLSILMILSASLYADLPKVLDYSMYLTLIRNQDSWGGCGAMATLHAFDIQMERIAPYCPDASYAFNGYVYNASHANDGWAPPDPRVPGPSLNQAQVIEKYGSCPETSFPTNYDNSLNPVPSDADFQEAMNYRIANFVDQALQPTSILEVKTLLYEKGPLMMAELIDQHIVALIGYDDFTQTVKYVNSWPDGSGGGIQVTSYSYVIDRFVNHGAWIKYLETVLPPMPEALSARIRISDLEGRRYLTVKLGVVGESAVTVWNCNGQVNQIDDRKDLAIDLPLPSYGFQHWPPRKQHVWYVEIEDHSTSPYSGPVGTVNEVTLVRRVSSSPDGRYLEKYSPYMSEDVYSIPRGGSTTIYIPLAPVQIPISARRFVVKYSCPHFPGCPTCPVFDVTQLNDYVSHIRRPILLEIYKGAKLLARLGRINEHLGLEWNTRAPNALVDKKSLLSLIPPDEFGHFGAGQTVECELRMIDPWDQTVLQTKPLVLKPK